MGSMCVFSAPGNSGAGKHFKGEIRSIEKDYSWTSQRAHTRARWSRKVTSSAVALVLCAARARAQLRAPARARLTYQTNTPPRHELSELLANLLVNLCAFKNTHF